MRESASYATADVCADPHTNSQCCLPDPAHRMTRAGWRVPQESLAARSSGDATDWLPCQHGECRCAVWRERRAVEHRPFPMVAVGYHLTMRLRADHCRPAAASRGTARGPNRDATDT